MTAPRQAPVKTAAEVASSGSNFASSPAQSPATTIALGSWQFDPHANEFRGSANFLNLFDVAPPSQSLSLDEAMRAIPAPDQERFSQTLRNALHAPEPFEMEHEIVCRDGTVRTVRSRGQLISAKGEESCRIVGTILDISGGRLAHRQLREREDKFRSLLDNLPDVVWTSSADGRTPYVSPNIQRVLGFTAEEMEKGDANWLQIIDAADAPRIADVFRRLFTEGQPFDVEYRAKRKDGRRIWAHNRAYRTYEKDGIQFADGVFSDITERKQAEVIRERLAVIVDSSDDAIISKTLEGTITGWNRGAENLFGYSSSEAIGRSMLMLFPTELMAEESGILERIARGESVQHYETVRVRKDGRRVEVSVTLSPIRDSAGTVIGASKIAHDITQRKQADAATQKAKEAAEAANLAKSQFLANMSHEIRTPMNGVIGVVGLLLDTELTPEQRHYAGIVRDSGEALMVVINDILDFSKIEAGKFELENVDFDLRKVLMEVDTMLAIKASEKGIELEAALEPRTPWLLRGDSGRLRQILINLAGNAVKFTQQGKVSIRVGLDIESLESAPSDKARLRFRVSDTGIGFRPDRAAAIFEPFVQADGSSTRRFGGTGLGLTISRQLCAMMGGQIGAESEEGKGSTFWFTAVFEKRPGVLLEMEPKQGKAADSASVGPVRQLAAGETSRARILLAEDNLTNQQVAEAILRKFGYIADVVVNGIEALRALRERDYDLVLMDCEMPEMDGFEATRRIRDGRAGVRDAQIPIVAFTAGAMSGDREKSIKAGMSDFLSKPVEPHQLRAMLEKWWNPAAGEENVPEHADPRLARAAASVPAHLDTAVFNPEDLLARLMGDANLGRKIVAAFLGDAPLQLDILREKLENNDAVGVRLQAHSLKGASAAVSAIALSALCREAESAAAAGDLSHTLALLSRMEEQLELLKATLRQSGWV